tara:strand:- start:464 stop:4561 length:4098 start_codon:yes stop_codon:yes gene_type:complete
MAELPKNIRKPGGALVSARSPFTRRVLLPTEADLCNALGLTEEEYFQFLEGVAAKVKERPEAYGLIPDIRCDPVSLGLISAKTGALTLFGQIAVGVALSVVAYLLTPKPPSMKQGTAERTADMAGLKRFAPQFSFNSVQELANLGDLIPLVFTNRDQNSNGGTRVNSQLMWSQLVSLGRFQQLKILGLFSLGTIEQEPDFEGYAIGDLLIENYQAEKIYLSNSNIPFKTNGGVFSTDIFRVDNLKHFSGARNPTTQATFGLSSPMPNLTFFRLPYELVRAPSKLNADNRPAARITNKKRRKLLGGWPMRAGFADGGNSSQKAGNSDLPVGTYLTYQVVGGPETNGNAWQQDWVGYDPHGVEDVNSVTKTVREATDSYISEGEQYLAGTALVSCTHIGNEAWPGQPWEGTNESFTRGYQFKVLESGRYECAPTTNLGTHCNNPQWNTGGDFFQVKDDKYYYEQFYGDSYLLYEPAERYVLQRINLGTVSDNRNCHITEIGIKSKVFKQMSFANVNSKPTEEEIDTVFNDRSSLTLGNVNKYITRYSFFKLQVREAGTGNNWQTLETPVTNHLDLFCVKGNTPEFQYNYIRIDHPYKQYEYRFFPWPGNDVIKQVIANTTVYVNLLNANGATDPNAIQQFSYSSYTVKFAGRKNHALTRDLLSNTEWDFGEPNAYRQIVAGYVQGLKGTGSYSSPSHITSDNLPQKRVSTVQWTKIYHPDCSYGGTYPGYGHHTVIVRFDNWPSAGVSTFALYINNMHVTSNIQGRNGPEWGDAQQPTSVTLVSAHGGGQTVSGVEFHYTTDDGRGGKFIPIVDSNISGSSAGGHPCGITNFYYVRKIEDEWQNEDPVINSLITTSDTDGSGDDIASGSGLQVRFKAWANTARTEIYAEWNLEGSRGSGYMEGDKVRIPSQDDPDDTDETLVPAQIIELQVSNTVEKTLPSRLNLYDAAADFWKYEGDQSSHLEGPEHQITYCNEIVRTEGVDSLGSPATYSDLAYAGLRINSSKEWTNFSQFSAYFKKGIKVKSLLGGSDRSTSLFPEIAYALLTNSTIGAGKVINTDSVNEANMIVAANFCKKNNLFWDGVISNRVNLREFIFEQATYCLLDFTIIGGQFSLYPAVPFDSDHAMNLDKKPTIKAMFTDGNIKDLNVAFLNPEDRQTFQANIIYRKEKVNGFSEKKSLVVRLVGSAHEDDPLETFDLSGFCTSPDHAITFGKYVLSNREKVDHTITFKTAPHYINGVQPGDYIRVYSTTQHVQRFNNGAILDDGTVVSKDTISGSKTFYYWNPAEQEVKEATANFSTPSSIQPYAGSLFTIKESEASDQCYKVESITFGEDGLIELSGSYSELTSDGKLAILQGWNDGSRFAPVES